LQVHLEKLGHQDQEARLGDLVAQDCLDNLDKMVLLGLQDLEDHKEQLEIQASVDLLVLLELLVRIS